METPGRIDLGNSESGGIGRQEMSQNTQLTLKIRTIIIQVSRKRGELSELTTIEESLAVAAGGEAYSTKI
jgi:hypothetical protein